MNTQTQDTAGSPILLSFLQKSEALLGVIALSMANWVGSWSFVFWHSVAYILWDDLGFKVTFVDIVNIEAIYLMCILLMAQKRNENRAQEEDLNRYKYIIKILEFNKSLDERANQIADDLLATDQRMEKRLDRIEKKRGLYL